MASASRASPAAPAKRSLLALAVLALALSTLLLALPATADDDVPAAAEAADAAATDATAASSEPADAAGEISDVPELDAAAGDDGSADASAGDATEGSVEGSDAAADASEETQQGEEAQVGIEADGSITDAATTAEATEAQACDCPEAQDCATASCDCPEQQTECPECKQEPCAEPEPCAACDASQCPQTECEPCPTCMEPVCPPVVDCPPAPECEPAAAAAASTASTGSQTDAEQWPTVLPLLNALYAFCMAVVASGEAAVLQLWSLTALGPAGYMAVGFIGSLLLALLAVVLRFTCCTGRSSGRSSGSASTMMCPMPGKIDKDLVAGPIQVSDYTRLYTVKMGEQQFAVVESFAPGGASVTHVALHHKSKRKSKASASVASHGEALSHGASPDRVGAVTDASPAAGAAFPAVAPSAGAGAGAGSATAAAAAAAAGGAELPEGWEAAQDANGRVYYCNRITGESSWELPSLAQ